MVMKYMIDGDIPLARKQMEIVQNHMSLLDKAITEEWEKWKTPTQETKKNIKKL